MPFRDRPDAGRKLAAILAPYKDEHPTIVALPRGGVTVAGAVAAALDAPLDLLLVRKIGTPFQSELAMGAVVDGEHPVVVRNEDVIRGARISEDEFQTVCAKEMQKIDRRRKLYIGDRERAPISGRTVIVIDDGIATGATMRAALRAIRLMKPAKLVLAVPVAPTDTLKALQHETDVIVCLEQPSDFGALGFYYDDFRQVSDREVVAELANHKAI